MASGFTRPEQLSRSALTGLAGLAKAGKATTTDYAKSSMTKKPGKVTVINPKTKA